MLNKVLDLEPDSPVMDETFTYRVINPADVIEVSELITRVFNQFIAPEYSLEGVQEVHRYIQPSAFKARQETNHFVIISVVQDKVVGVVEVRNHNHICLLFVAPEYQRRGIAKELFHRALQICQSNEPELSEISVNSSPYAVQVYEKLGFRRTGKKQIRNGIGFIPMVLKLSSNQQGDS